MNITKTMMSRTSKLLENLRRLTGEDPETLLELASLDPKDQASAIRLAHVAIILANNTLVAQPIRQDRASLATAKAAVDLVTAAAEETEDQPRIDSDEDEFDMIFVMHELDTGGKGNVGVAGSLQTLFYAEVTDDMRVSTGGGVQEEGEMIEVVELPLGDSRKFIMDSSINRPGLLLFAFMWFYDTKMGKK
ncbi:NUDT14 [Branchiostoma lanceolatum]|uniref:NUDT14 protein n=1 Tax=Branchiostoma lanceolatum TaxID=7740 RepID=A0A8K0EVJ1_BRALA|nr:NUDT14 [Branchiostoma lanceolatum]